MIYKVEPYVMAADVYSSYPHTGRGGWTWYTGSASWMYEVGLTQLLGITREGDVLKVNPVVPKHWSAFTVIYHYKETKYTLQVSATHVRTGQMQITCDGKSQELMEIPLINDLLPHHVEIALT